MNENVTLIPAKKRVGNRIVKEEKPKLRVRTVMSKPEVMKCRFSIIWNISDFIKNGNLLVFILIQASVGATPKSEKALWV